MTVMLHCHWRIVVFTEVEDADIRTNENDLDEFHPKSTRTLFVGNLEKDTTVQDLIGKFSPFGDVIVSTFHLFFNYINTWGRRIRKGGILDSLESYLGQTTVGTIAVLPSQSCEVCAVC